MREPIGYARGEKFVVTALGLIIVGGLVFWMLWVATSRPS